MLVNNYQEKGKGKRFHCPYDHSAFLFILFNY